MYAVKNRALEPDYGVQTPAQLLLPCDPGHMT